MKTILIVMPFQEKHRTYVEAIGKDCRFCYSSREAVTPEDVRNAEIILGNVPPHLLADAEKLEWIQLNSAGSDAYCAPGILRPDVLLTSASGAYGLAVAEGMLAMTMALCRKMDLYAGNQAKKLWQAEGEISSVWNSTSLILGLGDIGQEYARRMKALGSYTIGIRRNVSEKPDYMDELHTMDDLEKLLPRADFVAMSLPSTSETHHLMDEKRLLMMKKGSYLINAGRGDAVDCDALNQVLHRGVSLAGCALDVTEPEPLPADHPLWDAPRAIIMPHCAGGFHLPETFERVVRITGENLGKFLAGDREKMRNVVSH
ncbi:MAG TPA: D-2-hydroxyacid dehydrogenase [Candidatus Lachnoclostridium stercorigallinarum]|uniref:D-2-hydroxyacid dehydrogenase n=1 Tax=Candidatus Lachnoclostridium stercorigallinarum TaxID=2838634 RepID=A0A9D2GJ05_9FIRM|nr:D-2-hydroxyacid dehydrogenase [Candidatus Lachnoclostridium stercorigallinarum]